MLEQLVKKPSDKISLNIMYDVACNLEKHLKVIN